MEQQDVMATTPPILLIPDDVLVDVFHRVGSPRALALSRCVCRAWRALIDDRQLLRADLLPLSLGGLILCLNVEGERPELLARPGLDVTGYLMPSYTVNIDDHCNGLILIYNTVLNPATRRFVDLPSLSPFWQEHHFCDYRYLAFDPAESPDHYQVFCIPMVLTCRFFFEPMEEDPAYMAFLQSEWPPSPLVFGVFSSVTGRWETRSLARQGGAVATVHDLYSPPSYEPQHSACWRGALYIHCYNDFVLRIPLLSDDHTTTTYQVVKPPIEPEVNNLCARLGRSEKGVYFASFDLQHHLCVWILHHHVHDDDDDCHMEWVLRHRSAYGLAVPMSSPRSSSSWTLHNAIRDEDGDPDAQEWDSDDDGFHIETEGGMVQKQLGHFRVLGFHPYREIVFMGTDYRDYGGMAYHLKTSKFEYLGSLFPKDGTRVLERVTLVENAFPYTPCRMGAP